MLAGCTEEGSGHGRGTQKGEAWVSIWVTSSKKLQGPRTSGPGDKFSEMCVWGVHTVLSVLPIPPRTVIISFLPSRLRVARTSTSEKKKQAVETWHPMPS